MIGKNNGTSAELKNSMNYIGDKQKMWNLYVQVPSMIIIVLHYLKMQKVNMVK